MTWHYVLVEHTDAAEPYYLVHEAYYNKDGELYGITENGISPDGCSVHEIMECLRMMLDDCSKYPVLKEPITYAKGS